MEDLYLMFEQLRDIAKGRKTYNNDDEWEDNLLAQLKLVDDQMEGVYASAADLGLLDEDDEIFGTDEEE